MKSKILKLITFIFAASLCFYITACGESGDSGHTHSVNSIVSYSNYWHKYKCSCGETLKEDHNYNQKVISEKYLKSDSECESKLQYYYTCICTAKGTETFESDQIKQHEFVEEVVSDKYLKEAAKCESVAVYYVSCACGAKGESTFTYGSSLGHNYVYKIDKESTCTEDGLKHKECSNCGDKKDSEIIPAAHVSGEWIVDVEPTCIEKGSKHQVCSVCNDTINNEEIAAKGHTDGEWIIDFESTCAEQGKKHTICLVCEELIEDSIDIKEHQFVNLICKECNFTTLNINEIGVAVVSNSGLIVTLNMFTKTEYAGYYLYTINYTIKNDTPNSVLTPGLFKLFYTDGTGEDQYGSIYDLYYGQSITRSYSWRSLKNLEVSVLQYGGSFFGGISESAIHWLLPEE